MPTDSFNCNYTVGESVFDEVIESMAVAIVGELVVGGRELLEALGGDAGEIACELRVLGEDHRPPGDEAVDQRLLPHAPTKFENPNPRNQSKSTRRRGERKREIEREKRWRSEKKGAGFALGKVVCVCV